jgi:hypothetical protein
MEIQIRKREGGREGGERIPTVSDMEVGKGTSRLATHHIRNAFER